MYCGIESGFRSIMTFDKAGSFVIMTMAAKNKIYSISFQYPDKIFSYTSQLIYVIGIMRTHGIGRMMPVGNNPLRVFISFQVTLHPLHLCTGSIIHPGFIVFFSIRIQ